MATINQNSFKDVRQQFREVRKSFNEIINDIENQNSTYWSFDGLWNLNYSFDDIIELKSTIEHMLNNYNHFGVKKDYEQMLIDLNSMESDIKHEYANLKNNLGGFEDSEIRTMQQFKIERYI